MNEHFPGSEIPPNITVHGDVVYDKTEIHHADGSVSEHRAYDDTVRAGRKLMDGVGVIINDSESDVHAPRQGVNEGYVSNVPTGPLPPPNVPKRADLGTLQGGIDIVAVPDAVTVQQQPARVLGTRAAAMAASESAYTQHSQTSQVATQPAVTPPVDRMPIDTV